MKPWCLRVWLVSIPLVLLTQCSRLPGQNTSAAQTGPRISGLVTGLVGTHLKVALQRGTGPSVIATIHQNGKLESPPIPGTGEIRVRLAALPRCPEQACRVVLTASAEFQVTCETAPRVRFVSTNWGGEKHVRISDDVHSHPDSTGGSPRIVRGEKTGFIHLRTRANLTLDSLRGIAYIADGRTVKAFGELDSLNGDKVPTRTLVISGNNAVSNPHAHSLAVDAERDRLYVSGTDGAGFLWVFSRASALEGTVAPSLAIELPAGQVAIDSFRDSLYVLDRATLSVFDHASQLGSAVKPSRTISLTDTSENTSSVAVDSCRDELWISDRNGTVDGFHLVGFAGASTLNGEKSVDDASRARVQLPFFAMGVGLDATGQLWAVGDSAKHVHFLGQAREIDGSITQPKMKAVRGIVDGSYGIAAMPF